MSYMTEDEWRYICRTYGNNTQDKIAEEYDRIVKEQDLAFQINIAVLTLVIFFIFFLLKVL